MVTNAMMIVVKLCYMYGKVSMSMSVRIKLKEALLVKSANRIPRRYIMYCGAMLQRRIPTIQRRVSYPALTDTCAPYHHSDLLLRLSTSL